MKKFLLVVCVLLTNFFSYSQQTVLIGSDEYQNLKAAGDLNNFPDSLLVYPPSLAIHPIIQSSSNLKRENACEGWIEENDSLLFTLAMEPNDDGSGDLLSLPFDFCLYGETYNEAYINNNGNISFINPFGTFSAAGFPSNDFKMVAPFWADVDTRGIGEVLYAVTPTALIVKWVDVGYFAQHTDLINNFQLIVTDGTDPIVPGGNNVQFSYLDMQWTTGDASGGVDGFGGTAANVGANKGDGVDYIQFGRFDHDGIDYDGPFAGEDGVSWLDYETFVFNTCTDNSNIAPIINGLDVCDTLTACEGDTLFFQLQFLSPEEDQITTVTYDAGGSPYFGIISNVPGINANVTAYFVANPDNIGDNPITFTATDNGIPAGVSIATIVINVIENEGGDPVPEPILDGELEFCEGGSVFLVAENFDVYDYYEWSTGSLENDIEIFNSGTYIFTGYIGLCANSAYKEIVEHPTPTPTINIAAPLCPGDTATLAVANDYEIYEWSTGAEGVTEIDVLGGTYSVTVTDSFGCVGTSNEVNILQLNPVICSPDITICTEDFVASLSLLLGPPPGEWTIINQPLGSNVLFNPSVNNPNAFIFADSSGTYTFVFTDEACQNADTMNVSFLPLPTAQLNDYILCPGDTILLDAGNESGYQFFDWEWKKDGLAIIGENTQTLTVTQPGVYTISASNNGDCEAVATSIIETPTVNINTDLQVCGLSSNAEAIVTPNPNDGTWTTSNTGFTFEDPNNTATDIIVDNYGVYSIVFTENICNVSAVVDINFLPVPSAELQQDQLICISDTLTLNAGNNTGFPSFAWSWTLNGSPIANANTQILNVTEAGQYIVNVSSGASCNASDTIVIDEIVVDASTIQNICGLTSDATVDVLPLNVANSGSWTVNSNQLVFSNPNETFTAITASVYGNYILTYTDDRCPLDFDITDVIFYEQPEIVITNNEICPGDNLLLLVANVTGNNTGTFTWTIDNEIGEIGNDSIYYSDFINPMIDTLSITATVNSDYCPSATALLDYVLFVCDLDIPNVFSPNGDVFNQTFNIPFLDNIPENSVKVWNRWGNLVFDKKDYKNDWDGKDLSDGVYFYEIKVPIIEKPYKGSVTIIRK
jgi:gliding motility-associated-like protein